MRKGILLLGGLGIGVIVFYLLMQQRKVVEITGMTIKQV